MRRHSREDSGINLDTIEDQDVGEHNPKEYLEKLRKSAESSQRNSESPAKVERKSTPTRVVKKVIQKVSMNTAPVGTVVTLKRKPSGLVMLRGKSVDTVREEVVKVASTSLKSHNHNSNILWNNPSLK